MHSNPNGWLIKDHIVQAWFGNVTIRLQGTSASIRNYSVGFFEGYIRQIPDCQMVEEARFYLKEIHMALKTKRVYDLPQKRDGRRILVDRLWPRGLTKEKAQIDEWLREVAPSNELRKWFGHNTDKWKEFQHRYREELRAPEMSEQLRHLRGLLRKGSITLLFAAKDCEHNNARALAATLRRK